MTSYRDWRETPSEVLAQLKPETLDKFIHASGCIACGKGPVDAHHCLHKGAGGPDEYWNLIPLCRADHSTWHQSGAMTFVRKHPRVFERLTELGWTVNPITKRLWHPHMSRRES